MKLILRVCRLEVDHNLELWNYSDRISTTRECMNPKEFLELKNAAII